MRRKTVRILAVAVPAAVILTVIFALVLTIHRRGSRIETLEKLLQAQNEEQSEDSVPHFEPVPVDHNYELQGNKILLSDDTYGEIWLPVLSDVPLSTHPNDLLTKTANGRMTSKDASGNLNALTGIDVSAYNNVTDWNAVKADGVDFVMIRAGFRTYGSGLLKPDEKFAEHYQGAKAAGLKVGAYFFSQAVTEDEAIEEAVFTAERLYGYELDFPVAYDWEIIYDDAQGARTDSVSVDTLTDCVLAYCQNIEAFGYRPMYYQNKRTSLLKLDTPRLKDIPFWLAEYGDGPTFIYDYDMWQFSSTGRVNGIEGDVDMNLSFYDYSKEGAPAVSLPPPQTTSAPPQTTSAETQTATAANSEKTGTLAGSE